ncbi:MAG: PrgI family protein [Candidatus Ryanbacteria bacterium]|nr:PrgI family protein [Candidatus Ryanbacteria bacterium]
MQQFQVPQYIEIEDKIIGPLSAKQFLYVLAAGGGALLFFGLGFPGIIFWPLTLAWVSLFLSLAFAKINGQPFVAVLNNAINHITSTRLYIWKREDKRIKSTQPVMSQTTPHAPRLTESRLKNLSWSLDINEKLKRDN